MSGPLGAIEMSLNCYSGMVYDDAEKLYSEVRKDGKELLEEAFNVLIPNSRPLAEFDSTFRTVVGFNSTFFPRRDIIRVALNGYQTLKSQIIQLSKDGSTGFALMETTNGQSLALTAGLRSNCLPPSGAPTRLSQQDLRY